MRVDLSATSCRVINCQSLFPAESDGRMFGFATKPTTHWRTMLRLHCKKLLFKDQIARNQCTVWEPACFPPPWAPAIAPLLPTWRCRGNSLPTRVNESRSTGLDTTNEMCLKEERLVGPGMNWRCFKGRADCSLATVLGTLIGIPHLASLPY